MDDDTSSHYSDAPTQSRARPAVNRGDELNALGADRHRRRCRLAAVIAWGSAFRCAAISTVTIGRAAAEGLKLPPRAIVLSEFITSHSTPPGVGPARRVGIDRASVCPRRSSTPLGRARRGKMRAGRTRSWLSGSIATRMVRARSAPMPG